MYTEVHPVKFQGGIHNGTLAALAPFSAHGLTIGGLDPADYSQWDALMGQHRDPSATVEIGVNHPDPQAARDIATIARHTIWNGRDLWPGKVIPPERFNQGANYLRKAEGLPQEGPMQVAAAYVTLEEVRELGRQVLEQEHVESGDSAAVSGDMSVTSKWTVVALGELQQPGGVGATQDYNPVVDGPNPNGPDFGDNAQNGPEQEVALQTWVNMAVDLLNRGESSDAIVAQLAHDGCPDPQQVLQRAMQQPENAPVSDEIGQDPFQTPPSADPLNSGSMEGLSQQPAVMAKRVRIAGTTMVGTEIDRWESMWGEGTVKVALDGGGTLDVHPDAVQEIDGDSYKHPVSEIQSFIDSMPKVEPTRPHIEARLANLELVRRAVRANISAVGFSDQVKLQEMDSAAAAETALLKEVLTNHTEDYEVAYAKSARRFEYNAFKIATPTVAAYGGNSREAGAIWATENFDTAVDDDMSFASAAAHFASSIGLTGSQFQDFLAGAEDHRKVRTDEFTATEPETTDNDGPAEALFV